MNASVEAVPAVRHQGHLAPVTAPDGVVREGMLDVPGEVSLYHGGRLSGIRIAWRLAGPANAPVVCALGGISANRRVFGTEELPHGAPALAHGASGVAHGSSALAHGASGLTHGAPGLTHGPSGLAHGAPGLANRASGPRQGWWSEIVGPGRPLDADRFRVLSFDYLGGSAETTGPLPGGSFPNISTYDQAELLVRLLNNLGLKSLRAIVGGSYGGMVALAFGERYPERVSQLVVISAADRTHPMATAWRSVQRRVLRFGIESGQPKEGLQLARALAMSTYRSSEEFEARFDGAPERDGERFLFPVERYLFARGSDFADRHTAEAILCLSESIDLHRVDASRIFVPTTIVAVREDQLVPLSDLRGLAARLPVVKLHEISSIYGHDAFLKESDQLRGIFNAALGGAA